MLGFNSNKESVPPSTTVLPPTTPTTTLTTTMLPGCCGLKIIHSLKCLGAVDALSARSTEAFDDLVKVGTAKQGLWCNYGKAPETIAIISNSPRYNKPEEFARQVEFFKAKGWKQLASWKSMESGGVNYLWGSPGITGTEVLAK